MDKNIKIGDLVKSTYHVGIGIVLDVIEAGQMAPIDHQYEREPMAKIYWFFPDPTEGDGWKNGLDYDYLTRLVVINNA